MRGTQELTFWRFALAFLYRVGLCFHRSGQSFPVYGFPHYVNGRFPHDSRRWTGRLSLGWFWYGFSVVCLPGLRSRSRNFVYERVEGPVRIPYVCRLSSTVGGHVSSNAKSILSIIHNNASVYRSVGSTARERRRKKSHAKKYNVASTDGIVSVSDTDFHAKNESTPVLVSRRCKIILKTHESIAWTINLNRRRRNPKSPIGSWSCHEFVGLDLSRTNYSVGGGHDSFCSLPLLSMLNTLFVRETRESAERKKKNSIQWNIIIT